MKTCDIFYKSYAKDVPLLNYSLQSLKKNVKGYDNVIILIPETDMKDLNMEDLPENTTIVYSQDYGSGYLYQQICKLQAYKYSKADFILFADSDIIFDHPIDLQEIGKPEILYTSWDKVGDAICWKEPTEKFMGEHVEFEFMRRNTLIYHRSTLENIAIFSPNLEWNVMHSGRFSEFNAMGAYAFKYEKDKYNFVNTDGWEYAPPLGCQLWSWFDTGDSEVHKEEKQRALKVINETLKLNLTEL